MNGVEEMALKAGDQIPAPNFQNIPHELSGYPNFLLWKAKTRKGKPYELTKVPVSDKGYNIDANNPDNLWNFEVIVKDFYKGNFDGIGFSLVNTDLICIDLDNERIDNISKELTDLTTLGYTEISPSGNGFHIWIKGKKPPGMGKVGYTSTGERLEVFSGSGWLTLTGNVYHDFPIQYNQPLINHLYESYFNEKLSVEKNIKPAKKYMGISDLETIKKKMFNGHKGQQIRALWNGDISEYNNDHSRADFNLCRYLAFYSDGDFDTVNTLFRQSGLYRSKWDEPRGNTTYGDMTLENAIYSLSNDFRDDHRTNIPVTYQQPIEKEIQENGGKVSYITCINDEKYSTLLAKIESLEQLIISQQKYIDTKLNERDLKLMESLRQSQEEQQIATAAGVEKKGFFTRLFSKK